MGGKGSGRRTDAVFEPAPKTNPWERQPNDTDQAWAGFVAYRDMEGRTLAKATHIMGKKPGYLKVMEGWSRNNHWRERVEAWDSYRDAMMVQARIEAEQNAVREMVDRHIKISSHIQRLASIELTRWIHKIGGDVERPDMTRKPELPPRRIQSLLDFAVKLERLNRGEPESITAHNVAQTGKAGLTEESADFIRRKVLGLGSDE